MIHDLVEFSPDTSIRTDICIIGGGAAGIALAQSFIGSKLNVVVLESGGMNYDEETQNLAHGFSVGQPYYDIAGSRLRMLGGSTNHWQGDCTPLDEIDFQERPWVPFSGWPFSYQEIFPWYKQAHQLMALGSFDYDPSRIKAAESTAASLSGERLTHKVWQHSDPPMLFGASFSEALERAQNVDVFLHANFVGFQFDADSSHIGLAKAASEEGHSATIEATTFILAAGGLENPRILLNLEEHHGSQFGNCHDLVGRFFMEHLNLVCAEIVSTRSGWREAYQSFSQDERLVRHSIVLPHDRQQVLGVLNSAIALTAREFDRSNSRGYSSLHTIKKDIRRGRVPDQLGVHIYRIVTDLNGTWAGIRERGDESIWVSLEGEQAPNPDSRVTLSDERDKLGMRKLILDWRLSDIDFRTIDVLLNQLGIELGRRHYGRIRLEPIVGKGLDHRHFYDEIQGGYHHMGTTRMAGSECEGVVDSNCKVFGLDNLYVAGSSIFPTGGCANPTLTIVALALRLAHHLKSDVM